MAIAGGRRRHIEEEGESVFVSMTDLTVSFLFVILILLAFFATQFKPEETVPRDEYEALKNELSEACKRIRRLEEALIAARRRIDGSEKEQRKLAGRSEATEVERDAARGCEGSLTTLMREIAWLRNRIKELEAPDPLAVYLEGVSSARATLLQRLAERIRRQLPGIRVTVVAADGVIRFRGDDLFQSGRWRIRPGSTANRVSRAVGDALADTLPCYTVGRRAAFKESCNSTFAAIETIQIEGHTDSVPLSGLLREREKMLDNRDLSARRGAETLRAAADRYRPELMEFLNLHGQPVLSFAGYGAMRPIDPRDTEAARAANRRIDIRFILRTPQNLREVEEIRERLTQDRPNLPPVVNGNTR